MSIILDFERCEALLIMMVKLYALHLHGDFRRSGSDAFTYRLEHSVGMMSDPLFDCPRATPTIPQNHLGLVDPRGGSMVTKSGFCYYALYYIWRC